MIHTVVAVTVTVNLIALINRMTELDNGVVSLRLSQSKRAATLFSLPGYWGCHSFHLFLIFMVGGYGRGIIVIHDDSSHCFFSILYVMNRFSITNRYCISLTSLFFCTESPWIIHFYCLIRTQAVGIQRVVLCVCFLIRKCTAWITALLSRCKINRPLLVSV